MIPRQREGLVYAVVVDQFDLERPVRVQRQPASREHQVDLELVGWEREDAQLSTIIVRKMVDTYRRRARSPWSKGRGFPVQAKGCCSIQAPHTRPPLKKDFMIWIKIISAHLRVASEALTALKFFIGVTGEGSEFALETIHVKGWKKISS